mgnify:CR=1 FL=1
MLGSDGAPEQRLDAPVSFAAQQTGESAVPAAQLAPQDDPWTNIANYPASVMDNRVVNLDGKVYSIAGSNGSASTKRICLPTYCICRRRPSCDLVRL